MERQSEDYTVFREMLRISNHTWLMFHLLLNLIMLFMFPVFIRAPYQ
jgi:hypothetical protein